MNSEERDLQKKGSGKAFQKYTLWDTTAKKGDHIKTNLRETWYDKLD
jgi:hypothetical protein